MTTPAVLPPPMPAAGLSAEQIRVLGMAQEQGKKIRGAATTAKVDAVIMAIFAVCSILSIPIGYLMGEGNDWPGMFITLGLCWVTFQSFQGAAGIKKMDVGAPRRLATNQIVLMALIIIYSAWKLMQGPMHISSMFDNPEIAQGMPGMKADTDRLELLANRLLYGTLIIATLIAQPLTGLYYWTRAKHIRAYLEKTPDWVVQLQRQKVV